MLISPDKGNAACPTILYSGEWSVHESYSTTYTQLRNSPESTMVTVYVSSAISNTYWSVSSTEKDWSTSWSASLKIEISTQCVWLVWVKETSLEMLTKSMPAAERKCPYQPPRSIYCSYCTAIKTSVAIANTDLEMGLMTSRLSITRAIMNRMPTPAPTQWITYICTIHAAIGKPQVSVVLMKLGQFHQRCVHLNLAETIEVCKSYSNSKDFQATCHHASIRTVLVIMSGHRTISG